MACASSGDRRDVRPRPDRVARRGDRDEAGPRADQVRVLRDGQFPGHQVDLGPLDVDARPPGRLDPRPHVGVVVEPGHHDVVARRPRPGQRVGDPVRERGGARPEDHAVGRAADQVRDRRAGLGHDLDRPGRLAANAPPRFPMPARYAAAIASITETGTCVPAAPSRYACPSASAGYSARTAAISNEPEPGAPSPMPAVNCRCSSCRPCPCTVRQARRQGGDQHTARSPAPR